MKFTHVQQNTANNYKMHFVSQLQLRKRRRTAIPKSCHR